MKVTYADLRNTDFVSALPQELNRIGDNQYLAFDYIYSDQTSTITDIDRLKVVPTIVVSLHRGRKNNYKLGCLKAPFDTQDVMFYQFVLYYIKKNGGFKVKEMEKSFRDFLQIAKETDLYEIDNKLSSTVYENVFSVNDRVGFLSGVERFLVAHPQVKEPTVSIFDCVDNYYQKINNGNSFYGNCLEKIVMAVPLPQGGLISDKGGNLRYLYVGEKSFNLTEEDKTSLDLSKDMLRNEFTVEEIFAKTNWFFNYSDQKWKRRIVDLESSIIPQLPNDDIYVKADSKFADIKGDVFRMVAGNRFDTVGIENLLIRGWDIYLSDVLEHPTLYKHYPQLYKLPIFFGNNTKDMYNNDVPNPFSFYYSPKKYIVLMGNRKHWDLHTVLLHETQHAIQEIEGFGQGGDVRVLAKMINSIGGENVKEYFFILKKLKNDYKNKATSLGRYSYDKYNEFLLKVKKDYKNSEMYFSNEDDYYNSLDSVVFLLINHYLNLKLESTKKAYREFLSDKATEMIEKVYRYSVSGKNAETLLLGKGLNQEDVNRVIFETYELLSGEVESRDVQHSAKLDEFILGYSTPQTSEVVNRGQFKNMTKVTAIYDDLLSDERLPSEIGGALEKSGEGENGKPKYTIHLYENISAKPILHELGHIIYDLVGSERINPLIFENLKSLIKISNEDEKPYIHYKEGDIGVDVEEAFCEMFIGYLVRQNLSERFSINIDKGLELKEETFLDGIFEEVLNSTENTEINSEFLKRITFLKQLNELVTI
jgi:hypothetical protein